MTATLTALREAMTEYLTGQGLRALSAWPGAAALEEDRRMSEVLTLAYTVNEGHGLPVVNLILAPSAST